MCDYTLLEQLKNRQLKLKEVRCTCTQKCWCNDLSFRFPLDQTFDECMSPKEMLDEYRDQMDKEDIKYLKSLENRPFILN